MVVVAGATRRALADMDGDARGTGTGTDEAGEVDASIGVAPLPEGPGALATVTCAAADDVMPALPVPPPVATVTLAAA